MRKKKKTNRKGGAGTFFLILFICLSGTCLVLTADKVAKDKISDELMYISGALATGGEEKEDIKVSEVADISEIAEQSTEVSEAGTSDKIAAMFIGAALSEGVVAEAYDLNEEGLVVTSDGADQSQKENNVPVVSDVKGSVLIYHTHSTESYEPYSEGNFHITGSEGTVRNVADELENCLKAKGITVYHDRTLHDSPSYTNSYGRSLQTAKNYIAQYPDIKVVIDLHRDAMSSSGKKYSTITVDGVTAASFNIVVGQQNANYPQLMDFAGKVISKANELYPGLGGRIIEREYKFNQYLSNHYLLLEVGNNGNTIEETEATGRLLADVLEAVMREI